jgi:preprotein translocase subunit SecD
MYLGLDLRGGVHFLMQVDMKAALTKRAEAYSGDLRSLLRDKNIRHAASPRRQRIDVRFRDAGTRRRGAQPAADQPARPAGPRPPRGRRAFA